ncbi:MAG: ABC transporter ATP-binding protein/permease [Lachnospiraceae bacterium]|nr:ABC transporter ATP-binding protein/permease [Lachnospiraceae bacterium]
METLKKLNYLFDRKIKLRTAYVFILIALGSVVELLGIAIVLPIIELAMEENTVSDSKMAILLSRLIGTESKEEILLWLIGITVFIYIVKSFYLIYMNSQLYLFSADVRRKLSIRLLKTYFKQPYEFFLLKNSAELMRGVGSDTGELYNTIINVLRVISNGITAVSIIAYLIVTNFWMTITITVLLSICAVLIFLVFNKRFRSYGAQNQKYSAYMSKDLRQAFEGVKEIKVMGNGDYFVDAYERNFKKQNKVMNLFNIYNSIPKYLIETVSISGILVFLGVNVMFNDNYTALIPQLATFCVAAYKLMPSVNGISTYMNSIIFSRASIDLVYHDIKEIEELEKQKEKEHGDLKKMEFSDSIEVKGVSFRYRGTEKDVLSDVGIRIPKGHSVALIGPSGGGKTTMADIILGLLEPEKGSVLVDGVDIRNNLESWCKNIGYIPQVIYLTDDSIRKNVAFGISEKDIDDEQVWKALEGAQLKEFVKGLPNGLDTEVGEHGDRISGGQRQRIGIARALYRNPEILVFDEATSALDNETEKEVMKAIEGLQGTKTMLMIAHRLTTIEHCDTVYKVEGGKVEQVNNDKDSGRKEHA